MDKARKISVGSSSLVALKAELHRKQQESQQVRSSTAGAKRVKTPAVTRPSNAGVKLRDQQDRKTEAKEVNDLERSQIILEAKARLYDQLQNQSFKQTIETDDQRFLVNFQQKAVDDRKAQRRKDLPSDEERMEDLKNPESYAPQKADDEWVEYTDSLGRSRTVMRKDLAEYQRRDREAGGDAPSGTSGRGVASAAEDPLQQQRDRWEQQQLDNEGERDIHYQNVLFNEARAHGAGYFAFSEDADERARQRVELDQLRERTQQQQHRATETRKRSRQNLKERLRKVREKKRLKLGLPIADTLEKPLSENDKEEEEDVAAPEVPDDEGREKLTEDEVKKQEEREKIVREWDRGKEGVRERPVLSQQQWVHQQREQRQPEFAPPVLYGDGGKKAGRRGGPARVSGVRGGGAEIPPPQECNSSGGGGVTATDTGLSYQRSGGSTGDYRRHTAGQQWLGQDCGSSAAVMSYSVPPPGYSSAGGAYSSTSGPPPAQPGSIDHGLSTSTERPGWTPPGGSGTLYSRQLPAGGAFKRRATLAETCDVVEEPADKPGRGSGTEVAPPASAEYYGGGPKRPRGRGRGASSVKDMGSAIDAGLAMINADEKVKQKKTFDM